MLPAAHRLTRSADIAAVVRTARRGSGTLRSVRLIVQASVSPGRSESPPRVAFVVPRSVGGAVVRNRTKRRLRELMRQRIGQVPAGVDVVVRALPVAGTASSAALAGDLDRALGGVLRRLRARLVGA